MVVVLTPVNLGAGTCPSLRHVPVLCSLERSAAPEFFQGSVCGIYIRRRGNALLGAEKKEEEFPQLKLREQVISWKMSSF